MPRRGKVNCYTGLIQFTINRHKNYKKCKEKCKIMKKMHLKRETIWVITINRHKNYKKCKEKCKIMKKMHLKRETIWVILACIYAFFILFLVWSWPCFSNCSISCLTIGSMLMHYKFCQ